MTVHGIKRQRTISIVVRNPLRNRQSPFESRLKIPADPIAHSRTTPSFSATPSGKTGKAHGPPVAACDSAATSPASGIKVCNGRRADTVLAGSERVRIVNKADQKDREELSVKALISAGLVLATTLLVQPGRA